MLKALASELGLDSAAAAAKAPELKALAEALDLVPEHPGLKAEVEGAERSLQVGEKGKGGWWLQAEYKEGYGT